MFMKSMAFFAASLTLGLCGTAGAEELQPETINKASLASIPQERPAEDSPKPEPAIVHLQVLLDRAGSSPGVIDGYYGENVTKAIAGFEAMQHLPVDGKPDPELIGRLPDDKPAIEPYRVTEEDAKDLVERIPEDYAKQAEMKHLGYTSVAERLSERFHMDIDLLKALNPGSAFAVGDTVSVAMPGAAKEGKGRVKRIEARRRAGQVAAFAEDGSLIAVYPATIGSDETPSPSGTHKVKGVGRKPVYVYNPELNFKQGDNTKRLTLPSGPNNPVGSVWIDLTEPTYGIHGTPEPSLVDKAGSHGCVRLTNWDAEELAAMVKPGVVVEFTD
ncbi:MULTISPECIES: L,D-transpeptidase [unclassified Sinorhizobium]|uniref:L,D-transpeptidase family protein n=1 Tax=unclassified Sinorhizobium TaxID=2613772 RepID=UPI0024C2490C|nr:MULTISPECIES: L,D-transpeptidase [unclassified Sinorhizobium]MDK1373475.1 L,D-transpeptidase [Sinorhizobium sp. 6-70]MDK1479710.1 L,D-transpeptidase [Sinorhizobium sp. 6-117]